MLELKNTTLVCIDCKHPRSALAAIERTESKCRFAARLFISTGPIKSRYAYSRYIITTLPLLVKTDFVLIIQADGWLVNPLAWTEDFFNYDFIGAPWANGLVGNGGFSLRSRHCLNTAKTLIQNGFHCEDLTICKRRREEMIGAGVCFAPVSLAEKFSTESEYTGQFGFHGKHLIPSVLIWGV